MSKVLWITLSVLMALPIAGNAEVYKWKDKDGVTRYSDTPPPLNVQQLPISGKKPVAAPVAAAAPKAGAEGGAPAAKTAPAPAASGADAKKKPEASLKGDAIKRQEQAEKEKKIEEQKEADLQLKQQKCSNAKANFNTYKQGGRIRKLDENGKYEYLGDADIAKGLEQAQKEVDEFCEQ